LVAGSLNLGRLERDGENRGTNGRGLDTSVDADKIVDDMEFPDTPKKKKKRGSLESGMDSDNLQGVLLGNMQGRMDGSKEKGSKDTTSSKRGSKEKDGGTQRGSKDKKDKKSSGPGSKEKDDKKGNVPASTGVSPTNSMTLRRAGSRRGSVLGKADDSPTKKSVGFQGDEDEEKDGKDAKTSGKKTTPSSKKEFGPNKSPKTKADRKSRKTLKVDDEKGESPKGIPKISEAMDWGKFCQLYQDTVI
jgi:hypothetical protein